ncbi:hypothetical protein [Saccharopolyspora taberi]
MTAGHVLAAVFTGLALARAEQALFVVANALGLVLPRKPDPLRIVTELVAVCVPADTVRVLAELIHQRINALRGPPVHSC